MSLRDENDVKLERKGLPELNFGLNEAKILLNAEGCTVSREIDQVNAEKWQFNTFLIFPSRFKMEKTPSIRYLIQKFAQSQHKTFHLPFPLQGFLKIIDHFRFLSGPVNEGLLLIGINQPGQCDPISKVSLHFAFQAIKLKSPGK